MSTGEWVATLLALAAILVTIGVAGGGNRPVLISGLLVGALGLVVAFSSCTPTRPPAPVPSPSGPSVASPSLPSLTVSTQPTPSPAVAVHLTDVEPTEKKFNVDIPEPETSVGGNYTNKNIGIHPEQANEREGEVTFTIARKYRFLSTVAGISDKSPSGTTQLLQILGDGRPLFSAVITKGAERPVSNLDISGVYELKFIAIGQGPPLPFGSDFYAPGSAFVDPVVAS